MIDGRILGFLYFKMPLIFSIINKIAKNITTRFIMMLCDIFDKTKSKINQWLREYILYNRVLKSNIREGKSVICNNCTGAMMLHDLGFRFDTPTVNLWMNTTDYMLFVKSLPNILFDKIEEITTPNDKYPVGLLAGKVKLNFMHYSTFDEAVRCWRRRSQRVNLDNVYLICVDTGDDGKRLDLSEFEMLQYEKKVAFTRKTYDEYLSSYRIKGFDESQIMRITDFSGWTGHRYYDQFDFRNFFL
ncbi:DUF1919 domain-containing protein [Bacteroides oleiciplenus]|uniref:DUF1919 domain-containing protein n=1 Tax=Bacteroides oleiciplenus YIT 12058 TaxID=742727 RepID=K9EPW9_9BACE|nr:DUF1919 domain-containing protein [Bacteroides oleiciplenus]EKU91210.1 hypothetical protein HMPREF9447_01400 [Bacteroides oleiciplenus YIT 12058]